MSSQIVITAPDGDVPIHVLLADGQIRVLEIHPGQDEENISCTLRAANLEALPAYETLSYVWGDPGVTETITINGRGFEVTINLKAALRRIRSSSASRLIWVDAICINQANGPEKMQQIRLMRDIYQKCDQALLWLGEYEGLGLAVDDVQSAFETITKLAENGKLLEDDIDLKFFDTLDTLFQVSWFKRLWTVQEVVLPGSAVVLWGTESISWSVLEDASWASCQPESWPPLTWAHGDIANRFTSIVRTYVITKHSAADDFCRTLSRFQDRHATEPRDRIFGLFGLLPPHERGVFHIADDDYSSNIVKVHFQLAVQLILSTKSLRCFLGLKAGTLAMTPGLPTWAMDWASGYGKVAMCSSFWDHTWLYEEFDASAGRPLDMTVQEQDLSITLTGVVIDEIAWTSPISEMKIKDSNHVRAASVKDLYKALRQSVAFKAMYPHTSPRISNEEAIMRTLLNDCVTVTRGDPPERRVVASDDLLFERSLNDCQGATWPCLCQALLAYANGHIFFTTATGMFGMGPVHTKVGDQVWVLFGGRTPYVLKPAVEFGQRHYTLVGECYTHGIMDGEAVGEGALEEAAALH